MQKPNVGCDSESANLSGGLFGKDQVLSVRVTRVCRWNETSAQKIFITTIENPKQENSNVNPKF